MGASGSLQAVFPRAAQRPDLLLGIATIVRAPEAGGRSHDGSFVASEAAQFVGGWVDGSVWASGWQAAGVSEQPLSVLMHLYSGEALPAVADGLGYSPVQWAPGDIFIEYRDFGSATGQYLEIGLYNYVSGEALTFEVGGSETDRVQVRPLD